MKFGEVIEFNKKNISKIMQKMRLRDWFQAPFLFFNKALFEVKARAPQLSFNIF